MSVEKITKLSLDFSNKTDNEFFFKVNLTIISALGKHRFADNLRPIVP